MVQGEVTSLRKDRTGFKMGQNDWYKVGQGQQCPQKGDTIQFDVAFNDGRDNHTGPITVTQKSQWSGGGSGGGQSGGGAKSSAKGGYDNLGQQIGNAVSNASLLVAHGIVPVQDGKVIEAITKLAHQLVQVGDKVREMHTPQQVAPVVPLPQQTYQQPQPQAQYQQAPPQVQQPAQPVQQAAPQPAPGGFGDFDDDIPFN